MILLLKQLAVTSEYYQEYLYTACELHRVHALLCIFSLL